MRELGTHFPTRLEKGLRLPVDKKTRLNCTSRAAWDIRKRPKLVGVFGHCEPRYANELYTKRLATSQRDKRFGNQIVLSSSQV